MKRMFLVIFITFFVLNVKYIYAATCDGAPVYSSDNNGICCLQKYIDDNGSCSISDKSIDSNSKKLSCKSSRASTVFYYPAIKYTNYVANEYYYNDNTVISYNGCTFYRTEKIEIIYPKQNLINAGMGLELTINITETQSYYSLNKTCSNELAKYVKGISSEISPAVIMETDINNFQTTSNIEVAYSEISSNTEYIIENNKYEIVTKKVLDVPGYILLPGTGTVVKNDSNNATHTLYTKFNLNTKIYNLDILIRKFSGLSSNRYLQLDCDYKILSKYYETNNNGVVNKDNVNYYARSVSLTNLFPKRGIAPNWMEYTDAVQKIQGDGYSIYNMNVLYKMELTSNVIKAIRNYNDKNSYTDFGKGFVETYYEK